MLKYQGLLAEATRLSGEGIPYRLCKPPAGLDDARDLRRRIDSGEITVEDIAARKAAPRGSAPTGSTRRTNLGSAEPKDSSPMPVDTTGSAEGGRSDGDRDGSREDRARESGEGTGETGEQDAEETPGENENQPGGDDDSDPDPEEEKEGEDTADELRHLPTYRIRAQPFLEGTRASAPSEAIRENMDAVTPKVVVADDFIGEAQRRVLMNFAHYLRENDQTYDIHGKRYNTKMEHFQEECKRNPDLRLALDALESRALEIAEACIDDDVAIGDNDFVKVKDQVCIVRDFVFTPADSKAQEWHMDSEAGTTNVIIPLNFEEGNGTEFRPLVNADRRKYPLQHLHQYLEGSSISHQLGQYYPKDWNTTNVDKRYHFKADMRPGSALLFKGNQVHRGSKTAMGDNPERKERVSLFLAFANKGYDAETEFHPVWNRTFLTKQYALNRCVLEFLKQQPSVARIMSRCIVCNEITKESCRGCHERLCERCRPEAIEGGDEPSCNLCEGFMSSSCATCGDPGADVLCASPRCEKLFHGPITSRISHAIVGDRHQYEFVCFHPVNSDQWACSRDCARHVAATVDDDSTAPAEEPTMISSSVLAQLQAGGDVDEATDDDDIAICEDEPVLGIASKSVPGPAPESDDSADVIIIEKEKEKSPRRRTSPRGRRSRERASPHTERKEHRRPGRSPSRRMRSDRDRRRRSPSRRNDRDRGRHDRRSRSRGRSETRERESRIRERPRSPGRRTSPKRLEMCRFARTSRGCRHGSRCLFFHSKRDLEKERARRLESRRQEKVSRRTDTETESRRTEKVPRRADTEMAPGKPTTKLERKESVSSDAPESTPAHGTAKTVAEIEAIHRVETLQRQAEDMELWFTMERARLDRERENLATQTEIQRLKQENELLLAQLARTSDVGAPKQPMTRPDRPSGKDEVEIEMEEPRVERVKSLTKVTTPIEWETMPSTEGSSSSIDRLSMAELVKHDLEQGITYEHIQERSRRWGLSEGIYRKFIQLVIKRKQRQAPSQIQRTARQLARQIANDIGKRHDKLPSKCRDELAGAVIEGVGRTIPTDRSRISAAYTEAIDAAIRAFDQQSKPEKQTAAKKEQERSSNPRPRKTRRRERHAEAKAPYDPARVSMSESDGDGGWFRGWNERCPEKVDFTVVADVKPMDTHRDKKPGSTCKEKPLSSSTGRRHDDNDKDKEQKPLVVIKKK